MPLDRITFNADEGTLPLLEQRAASQKRTVSNYVALLVEKDLREAGLLSPGSSAELLAAAEEIGVEQAVLILRRAARRKVAA